MTIHQALQSTPLHDAAILLAHTLNKPLVFIFAHPEQRISTAQQRRFRTYITRRTTGEPLAYITRTKEFYGRAFFVNRNTLIPRPETELIIDLITQRKLLQKEHTLLLDIGTGSGNIIITLAKEIGGASAVKFCATDISSKALIIARKNATHHHCQRTVSFHVSNLLDNQRVCAKIRQHDNVVITANLPYVDIAQKKSLLNAKESAGLRHEPQKALWSQHGGLAHYQKLLAQTKDLLQHDVHKKIENFYEIDHRQKKELTKMIRENFPKADIAFHKDLAGKWRICHWTIAQ